MTHEPRVKITSNGTAASTRVLVDDKPIPNVIGLTVIARPGEVVRATIELAHIDVDALAHLDPPVELTDKDKNRVREARDMERAATNGRRLNEAGRRVLDLALREALSRGHNYIGPEHLRAALDRVSAPAP